MVNSDFEAQVVAWRRHLHQNPELSYKEKRSSDFVHGALSGIPGMQVRRGPGTSVIADLKGGRGGRRVALRADMDALPVQEETGLAYASKVPGVMHACGHDAHTAMLLGAARLLSERREGLAGELRFIFQHAEEVLPGGAVELVAAGVLDGVDAIAGAHVLPQLEAGSFGVVYGPAMASPDAFRIVVRGRGGHAAMPHATVDPVLIGAQLVVALQGIASRLIDPLDPVVVSVTQFNAGSAMNVIPQEAFLAGTVRTFKAPVRAAVKEAMERISQGVCASFGAECDFEFTESFPPVVNDSAVTALVERAIQDEFGSEAVSRISPLMAGEDFAAYQRRVPGSFFFIGVAAPGRPEAFPLHHPRFELDERALGPGARALERVALTLLED